MMTISNSGCVSKEIYKAVIGRCKSSKSMVVLCKVLKNGSLGKPIVYEMFGKEKTSQDVIERLERLNPGSHWIPSPQDKD